MWCGARFFQPNAFWMGSTSFFMKWYILNEKYTKPWYQSLQNMRWGNGKQKFKLKQVFKVKNRNKTIWNNFPRNSPREPSKYDGINVIGKVEVCWIMYQSYHNVRWKKKSFSRQNFKVETRNFWILYLYAFLFK